MAAGRLKAMVRRKAYQKPATAEVNQDDYYLARARKALTDHSRHQLEIMVGDWVSQQAATIVDEKQRWRRQQFEHHGRRIIAGDHLQQWPWSAKVRTTSTYFVPLTYGMNRKLKLGQAEKVCVLRGLCLRVSEHQELMWKPAQIVAPLWLNLESDAANDVLLIWNQRNIQPLKRRFVAARVEDFPDQTLAAIYKSCL